MLMFLVITFDAGQYTVIAIIKSKLHPKMITDD